MGLPLWIVGGLFLFQGALGDPMPGLLPEEAVSADVQFRTSTAFFPAGLLAGFALKRLDSRDTDSRRFAIELLLLAPWLVLYVLRLGVMLVR
jgi:hypothetical protein